MQRTAKENDAGLRRICKRSDQPKIERLESLALLFSKSYVCKMSSVLTETEAGASFKIPWLEKRTFSKSPVFVTD